MSVVGKGVDARAARSPAAWGVAAAWKHSTVPRFFTTPCHPAWDGRAVFVPSPGIGSYYSIKIAKIQRKKDFLSAPDMVH